VRGRRALASGRGRGVHRTAVDVTAPIPVDPSNVEMLQAWDGAEGAFWAGHDAAFDVSLARYTGPLLQAAAIGPDERVLDIGCGNGFTTRESARRATNGTSLGVDLSSHMIERARLRAAEQGIANVDFVQADAQIHRFDEAAFDVAISRAGVMFFGDPVRAFVNIARALRRGGRLALVVWQDVSRNPWLRDIMTALAAGRDLPAQPPDAPGPFSFAEPERIREILGAAGFTHIEVDGIGEPLSFGRTAEEAFRFLTGLGVTESMLRDLDATRRAQALAALRETVEAHETPEGVLFASAAWLVRARRA
jgi:SAM-dependent methyltransferase